MQLLSVFKFPCKIKAQKSSVLSLAGLSIWVRLGEEEGADLM
jgi:hypothetical protein